MTRFAIGHRDHPHVGLPALHPGQDARAAEDFSVRVRRDDNHTPSLWDQLLMGEGLYVRPRRAGLPFGQRGALPPDKVFSLRRFIAHSSHPSAGCATISSPSAARSFCP
ncbi:hypothetical protein PS928_06847 [Pseudomonas fluorescens]|uniref:Uncharacterized protein n=1 Tax=Pseudomonas fluorescens TaxID=294 RepID=A0A5E7VVH8_PSEFL|nr:hypothetical protein PS928_06847 [Pseudomonas fluorescens]